MIQSLLFRPVGYTLHTARLDEHWHEDLNSQQTLEVGTTKIREKSIGLLTVPSVEFCRFAMFCSFRSRSPEKELAKNIKI